MKLSEEEIEILVNVVDEAAPQVRPRLYEAALRFIPNRERALLREALAEELQRSGFQSNWEMASISMVVETAGRPNIRLVHSAHRG